MNPLPADPDPLEPHAGESGSARPWRTRRIERCLGRITDELLALTDEAENNISRLTALGGELLNADAALYVRRDGEQLHPLGRWHRPDGCPLAVEAAGPLALAVLRQPLAASPIVETLPGSVFVRSEPTLAEPGPGTHVGCAVCRGREPCGALSVLYRGARVPNADDRRVLGLLAAAIGQQEQRARDQEALRVKHWMVETSLLGSATSDRNGRLVYANAAFLRMWGYGSAPAVLGRPATEFWREPAAADRLIAELLASDQVVTELEAIRADGTTFPVQIMATLRRDASGDPLTMHGSFRDISAPKAAEAALQQANRQLRLFGDCNEALARESDELTLLGTVCRLAVESGGYRAAWVGYAEDNADRTVRPVASANLDPAYLRQLKVSWADDIPGLGPVGVAIRTGRLAVLQHLGRSLGAAEWKANLAKLGTASVCSLPLVIGGRPVGALTLHAVRPDAFDAEETALLQKLADNVAYGVAALRTKREREQAEEARRRAEDLYRVAVQTSPDGISLVEIDGRMRYASPKALEIYGVASLEQVIGRSMLEYMYPEEHARAVANFTRTVQEQITQLFEYRLLRQDGTLFMGEVTAAPLIDDAGRTTGVLAITRDVTERRRAGDLLRRMQVSVDLARDMVLWIEPDGSLAYANQAACRTLEYSPEELCRLTVSDIDPNHPRDKWQEVSARLLEQGALNLETSHRTKNGRTIPVEVAINPVNFEGRQFYCAFIRDLSERKRAEEARLELERRLLLAEKRESLGVLAGGVAHDFNNLLLGIIGNLEIALLDLPEGNIARRSIEHSALAGRRAADLVRQMLAYSGSGAFEVREVDLGALVRDHEAGLRAGLSPRVSLEIELEAGLPPIVADPSQLHLVVLNLIANAAEAVGEDGGTVHLVAHCADFDAAALAGSRTAETPPPGRYVVLQVSDAGCGMAETTLAKLFDPFFTTKFAGRGLGMSAILGIVQSSRGGIFITSEVNRGTSVRVLFPAGRGRVDGPAGAAPAVVAPAAPPATGSGSRAPFGSRGTLLIVDDEAAIRRVCRILLTRRGWVLLEASDGRAALELFQARAPELVGVLLDLSLPRVGGRTVLREFRQTRPDLPVIVISGAEAPADLGEDAPGTGVIGFLQKPFSSEALLQQVERTFAAGKQPER